MQRQFVDIPTVVVLTGLEIKSRVLFVRDRGPHVQRVRTHKKVAYALFPVKRSDLSRVK